MNTIPVTDEMLRSWWDEPYVEVAVRQEFTAPPVREADVRPCETVVTRQYAFEGGVDEYVSVPWRLDEIELARLAQGGVLWFSTMGGLPPHRLEVR